MITDVLATVNSVTVKCDNQTGILFTSPRMNSCSYCGIDRDKPTPKLRNGRKEQRKKGTNIETMSKRERKEGTGECKSKGSIERFDNGRKGGTKNRL